MHKLLEETVLGVRVFPRVQRERKKEGGGSKRKPEPTQLRWMEYRSSINKEMKLLICTHQLRNKRLGQGRKGNTHGYAEQYLSRMKKENGLRRISNFTNTGTVSSI